jgi:hypothetical protein
MESERHVSNYSTAPHRWSGAIGGSHSGRSLCNRAVRTHHLPLDVIPALEAAVDAAAAGGVLSTQNASEGCSSPQAGRPVVRVLLHLRRALRAHPAGHRARLEDQGSSERCVTALPKVDTNCNAPSLIPTVNGNTVRSFSTHGQQSAAQGSSATVSRSDIRLIQYFDFSAHGLVRRWLNWLFPYPLITSPPPRTARRIQREQRSKRHHGPYIP